MDCDDIYKAKLIAMFRNIRPKEGYDLEGPYNKMIILYSNEEANRINKVFNS